ncbi:MAG: hypothetical protein ABW061_28135 [Polyangiaceae bacterium]
MKGLVVSNVPPPLLGFNNNVRHRGRIFHIQTEDSGVKNPRIVTHLFADGGRIIKTTRTEYAEHVERPDVQAFVRSLMKEQHKNMFTALRLGDLDVMLENVCGKFELPLHASKASAAAVTAPPPADVQADVVMPLVTVRSSAPDFETPPLASAFGDDDRFSERPERANALSNPNLRKVVPSAPPPTAGALDMDTAALERLPKPLTATGSQPPPLPARPLAKSNPPPRKLRPSPSAPAVAATPSLSRPSSRFAAGPSKSSSSIFGDGVISEQSLDEVILSYLAEDLDGSSE